MLTDETTSVTLASMTVATEGRVPADTLPHRLVLLRLEKGWSQREASLACGVTYGEWQSMEAGRKATALNEKVEKIARASGYDRDWIMWGGPLAPPQGPDGGGKLPHLDSNQKPFGFLPKRQDKTLALVSTGSSRVTSLPSVA